MLTMLKVDADAAQSDPARDALERWRAARFQWAAARETGDDDERREACDEMYAAREALVELVRAAGDGELPAALQLDDGTILAVGRDIADDEDDPINLVVIEPARIASAD